MLDYPVPSLVLLPDITRCHGAGCHDNNANKHHSYFVGNLYHLIIYSSKCAYNYEKG